MISDFLHMFTPNNWIIWLILAVSLIIILFYIYQSRIENTRNNSNRKTRKEPSTKKNTLSTDDKKKSVAYPSFRKQKSGLTWGGGNVHGANAKRGQRKSFLKK